MHPQELHDISQWRHVLSHPISDVAFMLYYCIITDILLKNHNTFIVSVVRSCSIDGERLVIMTVIPLFVGNKVLIKTCSIEVNDKQTTSLVA